MMSLLRNGSKHLRLLLPLKSETELNGLKIMYGLEQSRTHWALRAMNIIM